MNRDARVVSLDLGNTTSLSSGRTHVSDEQWLIASKEQMMTFAAKDHERDGNRQICDEYVNKKSLDLLLVSTSSGAELMPRMPSLLASAADFVSIVNSLLLPVPSLMHQDIRVEPMEKILPLLAQPGTIVTMHK